MTDSYTIIIAGVGGQGGLTLSRIIANAAMALGYNVRVGETLGMSQRFGSVQGYVRFGRKVHSPLPLTMVNAIIGLEPLETVRAFNTIDVARLTLINVEPIHTQTTIIGNEKYPKIEKLLEVVKLRSFKVKVFNATKASIEKFGTPIQANMILLGLFAASEENPIPKGLYEKSIVKVLGVERGGRALEAFAYGFKVYRKS